jgi:hypothetical protein
VEFALLLSGRGIEGEGIEGFGFAEAARELGSGVGGQKIENPAAGFEGEDLAVECGHAGSLEVLGPGDRGDRVVAEGETGEAEEIGKPDDFVEFFLGSPTDFFGVDAAADADRGANPEEELAAWVTALGGGDGAEGAQAGFTRRASQKRCAGLHSQLDAPGGPGVAVPAGDVVVGEGVGEGVAVGGSLADAPDPAAAEQENGDGQGQVAVVLAEKFLEMFVLELVDD